MKPIIKLGALGGNDRLDITTAVSRLSKLRGDDNRTRQLLLNKLEKATSVNRMVQIAEYHFPNQIDFKKWSDHHQKWYSVNERTALAEFFPKL